MQSPGSVEPLTVRMLAVLALGMVIGTILPPCEGINATITPLNHGIFEAGTNLTLYCTLLGSSDPRTAADIVWRKGNEELPDSYYSLVNETVSRLCKSNASFNDSGNYACSFPGEPAEERYVTVGATPDPVRNLKCSTSNTVRIYCQWRNGLAETNVRNSHSLKWRRPGLEFHDDAFPPVKHQDGSYSYIFDIDTDRAIQVVVTTKNAVGSSDSSVVLEPLTEAVPNKPTSIMAVPGSLNESRWLDVTWQIPPEWPFYYGLNYRIRYKNLATQEVKEVSLIVERWYRLGDLVQYTDYEIGIAAISIVANPSDKDPYWSDWGEIRAKTQEGAPFGKASNVTIGKEDDSAKDLRNIKLYWKPVPDSQKGSDSVMYEVTLTPQDLRNERTYKKTVQFEFADFEGLHKYRTYKVLIQSKNGNGSGLTEDFGYVIPDRTGKPSEPRNVNVTVIDHILKVTWDPPENPNGIVEKYRVTVRGNVTLTSNQTGEDPDYKMGYIADSTESLLDINCTDRYSVVGETVEVTVSALTRNFTDHFFEGDHERSLVDGICSMAVAELPGANVVLWSILVPMMVIICCVILIAVWNFFKEFWVEPPDPEYPKSIISNGQFRDIGFHPGKPQEREHFDELRRQGGVIPDPRSDVVRGHQTDINSYHLHPSSLPKVLRNLSQDSGFSGPESPTDEAIDIDSVFHNHSLQGEAIPEDSEFRPPLSGGTTEGNDWRDSVFSSGSGDSGTEVRHESVATERSMVMSTTSMTTDQSEVVEPYMNVTEGPSSLQKTGSPPLMAHGVESRVTTDDRESLVCDEAGPEGLEFLSQYQLSPVSRNVPEIDGVNPYLAMAALTPPPTSIPSGYVPTEVLTKAQSSPIPDPPSTPDGYQPFSLLEKKRMELPGLNNNGYVDHRNLKAEHVSEPTAPQSGEHVKHQMIESPTVDDYVKHGVTSPPEVEDYVKHQSMSSPEVDYRDDYDPGFIKEVRVDDRKGEADLCKQMDDGYVQRPILGLNPPTSMGETPGTRDSTESQVPYCKVAHGE